MLSQVFLLARDSASYEYASSNEIDLRSFLERDGKIVRQNEVFDLPPLAGYQPSSMSNGYTANGPSTSSAISFQVTLTEPVLQGYILQSTEIIVLPPLVQDGVNKPNGNNSNMTSQVNGVSDWHVDEDFLAGGLDSALESALNLPQHLSATGTASSTWQSPLSSPSLRSLQLDAPLSEQGRLISNSNSTTKGRLIRVTAINEYIDEEDLTPLPEIDEDEHIRAFVKVKDLTRLGLFSGDKVEICALGTDNKRIVRVYGLRTPPQMPDK